MTRPKASRACCGWEKSLCPCVANHGSACILNIQRQAFELRTYTNRTAMTQGPTHPYLRVLNHKNFLFGLATHLPVSYIKPSDILPKIGHHLWRNSLLIKFKTLFLHNICTTSRAQLTTSSCAGVDGEMERFTSILLETWASVPAGSPVSP